MSVFQNGSKIIDRLINENQLLIKRYGKLNSRTTCIGSSRSLSFGAMGPKNASSGQTKYQYLLLSDNLVKTVASSTYVGL